MFKLYHKSFKGGVKTPSYASITTSKLYHKSFKGGVKTQAKGCLINKLLYHKSFKGGVKTVLQALAEGCNYIIPILS